MSEVKKLITRWSRDFQGNLQEDPNGSWVLAADAAIRDKRLMDKIDQLQQRLTAADERAYVLERDAARYRWIRDVNIGPHMIDRLLFQTVSDDCNPPYRDMKHGVDLDEAIDAALKPAEGGGDEPR